VSTAAARAMAWSQAVAADGSAAIANFGSGSMWITVRVVAP
jgi:hypothetical protein